MMGVSFNMEGDLEIAGWPNGFAWDSHAEPGHAGAIIFADHDISSLESHKYTIQEVVSWWIIESWTTCGMVTGAVGQIFTLNFIQTLIFLRSLVL